MNITNRRRNPETPMHLLELELGSEPLSQLRW